MIFATEVTNDAITAEVSIIVIIELFASIQIPPFKQQYRFRFHQVYIY